MEAIGYVAIALLMLVVYHGTSFILRFLFRRKSQNWVARNYKDHSGVDFHKVTRFMASQTPAGEEFSPWEMVAVFGLLLVKNNVTDVFQKATVFGSQGWRKNFNDDFYNEMAQIAKKISLQGDEYSARNLMLFGKRLAEMYEERTWVEQYKKILDEQLVEETYLEWDRSRR